MPLAAGPKPSGTHRDILERLLRSGLLEDGRMQPGEEVVKGRLVVSNHAFWLRVDLSNGFPLRLPALFIDSVEPPIILPHVSEGGLFCFEQDADLLDSHEPWAIVRESLLMARAALQRMLDGSRAEEFAREMAVYWAPLARRAIICIVEAGEQPHRTKVLVSRREMIAVADDARLVTQWLPERRSAGLTQENALYVPVDPAVDPAFEPSDLTTLEGLRRHVEGLPEEQRRRIHKLIKPRVKREEFMVLGVRRPGGERALVGVNLHGLQGAHPLVDKKTGGHVEPVALERKDVGYLAPRGGASLRFRKSRVLLAGCGSVGGHIALALARAGVGRISLVDPDRFELANTYRHVCGMAWSGQPKVTGLRMEIERLIPYVEVNGHAKRLEELLRERPRLLSEHDLLISAIGHPAVELCLNEQLWSNESHPPALFAWVEPLGLGGHVLLTHVRGPTGLTHGCMRCIYQRPREGGPLRNRAAFAAPGGNYTRDATGCGSLYLPFGDLDAQRTAEVTVRLALKVLGGELQESPLVSWKGDRGAFEEAGHQVTSRFELEPGQLGADRLLYWKEDCEVCGKGG